MAKTNTIEREVVKMEFDAKQFISGIKNSLQAVTQLKSSLEFSKSKKSLEGLATASKTDFGPLAKSLDLVNSKLSVAGVAASVFVTRVTGAVLDGVKKMADMLFIDPLKTGLEEYETQLNAVQTILANTAKQGTTLEDVNNALDELNSYADLTIYNFTQMTDSIGKFTTAGVDLDTSVSAIKGIANVAALSGSNANQASTAMYQLSQAISSGIVRLQDWISVENAGMGGQVFKDALLETARVHGVAVDSMIENNGSFRNSLQENWLTSDILLETLDKFTGDMTDAQLLALGYTEEQIKAIQEVAITANDAATKIKTLTQLKDTMAEALQSGWATTWRIVFGDFEEAKELWGAIGGYFGDIIANSSDARNALLGVWAGSGGRDQLIQAFWNVLKGISETLSLIGRAFREVFGTINVIDLLNMTEAFLNFSSTLEFSNKRAHQFKNIFKGLFAVLDILRLLFVAILKPIKELIISLLPAGAGFFDMAANLGISIVALRDFIEESGFFDKLISKVGVNIGELISKLRELWEQFKSLDIIQKVIDFFSSIEKSDIVNFFQTLGTYLMYAAGAFYYAGLAIRDAYLRFLDLELVQKILAWLSTLSLEKIKVAFRDLSTNAKELWETFTNNEIIQKTLEYLSTFDGRRFKEFISQAKDELSIFQLILDKVKTAIGWLGDKIKALGEPMAEFGAGVKESLVTALNYLIDNADDIDYEVFFKIIESGLLGGLLYTLRDIFRGSWLKDALGSVFGEDTPLVEGITNAFGQLESTLLSFQNNLKADSILKIALAIGVLTASIIALTFVDTKKLIQASAAVALMIATLFGAGGALSKIDVGSSARTGLLLLGISSSMLILTKALIALSVLDPKEIAQGLAAVSGGLLALMAALKVGEAGSKTGGAGMLKRALLLNSLALSMGAIAKAVEIFGKMDMDVIVQGLIATVVGIAALTVALRLLSEGSGSSMIKASVGIAIIAGALLLLAKGVETFGKMETAQLLQGFAVFTAVLVAFAAFSKGVSGQHMVKSAAGVLIASVAMVILGEALKSLGSISWEDLGRGLVAMTAALLVLVIAANAMRTALPGAFAMIVVSAALFVIAKAMEVLGKLSWEEILKGLVAIAGVFVVLGLAGLVLAPVIPVLLALGGAMLLIGLGALALGAGLSLAAIGLVAIAGSSIAVGEAIKVIGSAILELMPQVGEAIALGLTSFVLTVAEQAPLLLEAFKELIRTLITAVVELVPEIIEAAVTIIKTLLEAIAEVYPDIVQAGWDLLTTFLQGIADNIEEVITQGLAILTAILDGLEQGIPDLVDSAFNLVLTFIDSLALATEEYLPQIIEATGRLGAAIVDGIKTGVTNKIEEFKGVIRSMAQDALDLLADMLGIASPSTKTRAMGNFFVAGFVGAIRSGAQIVKTAITKFGKEAQNGMEKVAKTLSHTISQNLTLQPALTPVLDLSNVGNFTAFRSTASATDLQNSMNAQEKLANLISQDDTKSGDSGDKVEFTQIINSPTPLNTIQIYRNTKSAAARLENRRKGL